MPVCPARRNLQIFCTGFLVDLRVQKPSRVSRSCHKANLGLCGEARKSLGPRRIAERTLHIR
eukprot:4429485-Pyramimonas_sp.AAC.1